jgi:ferredoxin, 2Fe-2S
MAKILFLPTNKEVEVRGEENVLLLALRNRIPIATACGGSGSCGTCRVFVKCDTAQYVAQPRNEVEEMMADDRKFKSDERLACQIEPIDGMIVTVVDEY